MSQSESAPEAGPECLRIEGEMNVYRAGEIKALLLGAVRRAATLELDLSAVAEFDSAGFQLLYLVRREARSLGHGFRVTVASEAVTRLIDFYNMPELLPQTAVLMDPMPEMAHG